MNIKKLSVISLVTLIMPPISMTPEALEQPDPNITCAKCQASCCRLEVMIITDTGVPPEYIAIDEWGREVMERLDDGWCAALDRDTLRCTIYDNRPWICREFEMGSYECSVEFKDVSGSAY